MLFLSILYGTIDFFGLTHFLFYTVFSSGFFSLARAPLSEIFMDTHRSRQSDQIYLAPYAAKLAPILSFYPGQPASRPGLIHSSCLYDLLDVEVDLHLERDEEVSERVLEQLDVVVVLLKKERRRVDLNGRIDWSRIRIGYGGNIDMNNAGTVQYLFGGHTSRSN